MSLYEGGIAINQKTSKRKKFVIKTILIVLIVVILLWIMPGTKRFFPSYSLFRASADHETYLQKLPTSAKNMKYYVYDHMLTDKSGYRMVLSPEDYRTTRQEFINNYDSKRMWGASCYDDSNRKKLTKEQMQQMDIEFLNELLLTEGEYEQYYILADLLSTEAEKIVYEGVLCNDATCEIIEFTCYRYFGGA